MSTWLRHIFSISLAVVLLTGCKKEAAKTDCARLQAGMASHNVEEVKFVLTDIISQLPSKTYYQTNIQALTALISSRCDLTATMLCFDCIKTLPSQTEIRLSYSEQGATISKIIDISYSPDNKMKVVNMHD